MTEHPPSIQAIRDSMSERDFQASVKRQAEQLGWHVSHFHDSRRQVPRGDGQVAWIPDRDAAGVPDLLLIRERIVWMELKRQKHNTSKPRMKLQQEMVRRINEAGGEAYIFRPSDQDKIDEVLK